MKRLIQNFFLLVLRVLSNATPDSIYESFSVTQTFLKGSLELNPSQGIFDYLVPILVLIPIKADLSIKKQSCK